MHCRQSALVVNEGRHCEKALRATAPKTYAFHPEIEALKSPSCSCSGMPVHCGALLASRKGEHPRVVILRTNGLGEHGSHLAAALAKPAALALSVSRCSPGLSLGCRGGLGLALCLGERRPHIWLCTFPWLWSCNDMCKKLLRGSNTHVSKTKKQSCECEAPYDFSIEFPGPHRRSWKRPRCHFWTPPPACIVSLRCLAFLHELLSTQAFKTTSLLCEASQGPAV